MSSESASAGLVPTVHAASASASASVLASSPAVETPARVRKRASDLAIDVRGLGKSYTIEHGSVSSRGAGGLPSTTLREAIGRRFSACGESVLDIGRRSGRCAT